MNNHCLSRVFNPLSPMKLAMAATSRRLLALASLCLASSAGAMDPGALPTGGDIIAGQGSIGQHGNQLTVDQGSQQLIVDWNTFNIGEDAAVRFNQSGADAVALNRIFDQDPSRIFGSLSSDGQIFLVNPSGLYFGENAQVDVGGLVASSLAIGEDDFLAGRYRFTDGNGAGGIYNGGRVTAGQGGVIAFIAPQIVNDGALVAPEGSVAMAAGDRVTLDFRGDGLINLSIDEAALDAQVENRGLIRADGGMVGMTARAASDLQAVVVNNSGIIEANTVSERNGRIFLDGGETGITRNSGTLSAVGDDASETGGAIVVTGDKVGLFGESQLDASGEAGGGTVHIGGGFQGGDRSIRNASQTVVGADATISADAVREGDGGEVVVWSDKHTRYQGAISSRGGTVAGDGGLVEVSGKESLAFAGTVDAGAANGQAGSLLLDPKNLTVQADGGATIEEGNEFSDLPAVDSIIDPDTITAVTNTGTEVVLQATNDLTVNSSIFSNNTEGKGGDLSLHAGRSMTINASIDSDDGNISLHVNDEGVSAAGMSANRDAGAANFVNNSLIDAGAGEVSITMGTESTSGTISTGQITANRLEIAHDGQTEGAASGRIDLGEIDIDNDLNITSTLGRNLVNTVGTLSVRGTATIDVGEGDVTLTRASTDFNKIGVNARNVSIVDANALNFTDTDLTGNLTATTTGPMVSDGFVKVAGQTSLTANSGDYRFADPYIRLNSAENDFQGGVTLSVDGTGAASTGGYAELRDANALELQTADIATSLTVNAGGAITVNDTVTAGDNIEFTAGDGMDVNGGLTAGSDLDLTAGGGITATASITAGEDLNVSAQGAINASAKVTAADRTTLSAGATNDISLEAADNDFNFVRVVSGNNVSLVDSNEIVFGNSTGDSKSSISGDLEVVAGGTISQYGGDSYNYSPLEVAGDATFTVTAAGSDLKLGPADPLGTLRGAENSFGGVVTISVDGDGSYRDIQLRNTHEDAAVIEGLGAVGSLRNVLLRYDNAAGISLPEMELTGNLTVSVPEGGITQAGAWTVNDGLTLLRASSEKDIVLDNAQNDFDRITVDGARDLSLTDVNAVELATGSYQFTVSRDLAVTAGGDITDGNNSLYYYISATGGNATFDAGSNDVILDNSYNRWKTVAFPSAGNVVLGSSTSVVLDDSTIAGTGTFTARLASLGLSQVADSTVTIGDTTTFQAFGTINLPSTDNVFGDIAIGSGNPSVTIRENDAITQASAWSTNGSVSLTTSNDQAIDLGHDSNWLGALTIVQVNDGAEEAGDVTIHEANSITQDGAWTTHGNTRVDSGIYSIVLDNTDNVLGPLQVVGGSMLYGITIVENDAITDFAPWAIATNASVGLNAYKDGVSGVGDILLTQTDNVIGHLTVQGHEVTITENDAITDSSAPWVTTGVTTLNAGARNIDLDNLSNTLGPILVTGTPGSVRITENSDLTQAGAWQIGAAPVTLDARSNAIDLSSSGNVLGAISITTTNGTPSGVSITENDSITQGSAWALNGVPVTLWAENDHSITLNSSTNQMGNLTITGGAVSIRENDAITQGGAWTTTGTTTLNAGANAITLKDEGNVLGDLAIADATTALTLTEDDDITQASAWNLGSSPVVLNAQSSDIILTEPANILGDLELAAQNVSITENDTISDGNGWTVPGLTTLDAGDHAIVLDANPHGDLGTVKIVAATSAEIEDINGLVFEESTVDETLTVSAGGAITQTGAITADALLLTGTGNAVLDNENNDVAKIAAGFSGGELVYTDADDFEIAVLGGTTGINIGANNVSLRSVGGTVTGLSGIAAASSALAVDAGTGLTLPAMSIAGPQTYTAADGILLNGSITSTESGAITFNSPLTLGSDITIQSRDSVIDFHGTVDGAGRALVVNAGDGSVAFDEAVEDLGSSSSVTRALQLTSGGATFSDVLAANNGISVSGPVVFLDDIQLGDGNEGTVFAGHVTFENAGGTNFSAYDGISFNGGLRLADGPATITSNDSALVFQGGNTIEGASALTLDAGLGALTGLDHVASDLTSLTVTAYGPSVPDGLKIAGAQSFTATGDSSIRLNGAVESTAAGTISFHGPVRLNADAHVQTVDSSITFHDTVDGAHDLTVDAGSAATVFDGAVGNLIALGDGTGTSLNLAGSGTTDFNGTVETASGMSAAGAVNFHDDVTLGDGDTGSTFSGLVTTGDTVISGHDDLTFQGGLDLDGGPVEIRSNGGTLDLGGPVSVDHALTLNTDGGDLEINDALTGSSTVELDLGTGDVSGLEQLAATLTGLTIRNDNAIEIPALVISGGQVFHGPVTLKGNLTGTSLRFNGATAIGTDGLELLATDGGIDIAAAFNAGANDLTLTGDEIDLSAALSGTGELTLRPSNNTSDVRVGGSGGTAALDLSAIDLAQLAETFESLTLGRTDGTGGLIIIAATDLGERNVRLNGVGGISQSGSLVAGDTTLFTSGNAIELDHANNSLGDLSILGTPSEVSITDHSGITQGAAWILGASPVTLDSGDEAIVLTQAGNVLGTLALKGGKVTIVEADATDIGASTMASLDVDSTGAVTFTGALVASEDVSIDAGGLISQTAPLTIGGDLSLTTTHVAGDVTIDNSGAASTITGNTLVGGSYLLTADGQLVSQASGSTIRVAGDLGLDSDSTRLDAAGNLVGGTTTLPGHSLLRQAGVVTLGDVTEAGDFTVISEAANRSFDGGPVAGAAIDLSNTSNNVGGAISVQTEAPTVTEGAEVQTGIVQAADTSISVGGLATFVAEASKAGSLGIQLANNGNEFSRLRLDGSTVHVKNDAIGATELVGVNASTDLILETAGAVSQSGIIVAPRAAITAAGTVALEDRDNNFETIAIDADGNVTLATLGDLEIGEVGAVSGIHTHGGDLALLVGGNLSQTEILQDIGALGVLADGSIELDSANSISKLSSLIAGDDLTVVNAADGLAIEIGMMSRDGDVTVRTAGDLVLETGSMVMAAGDIAMSAEDGGNFINRAGANALSAGDGHRWLVYSTTPDLVGTEHTEKDGLTSSFRRYGETFASDAPGTITDTGNGFIYSELPNSELTVGAVISGAASHVYGDDPTGALAYVVTSGFVDSEDTAESVGITGTATYSQALANSMDAGTYSIFYTGGLTSSYTLVADTTGATYEVEKATLTYVADAAHRVYGDSNPALSGAITGFKLGQDLSYLDGSATWTTAADKTSDVGQYAIVGSGYSSDNYTFTNAPGNSTALTVNARPITVTATDQGRIYGNSNPVTGDFSVGGSGLVNGDALAGTVAVASDAIVSSGVGDYALTPSGAFFTQGSAGNYAITYEDGTLTVTPRPITLTADDLSRVYGDLNPASSGYSIGGDGLVKGDALAATLDVSSDALVTSGIGDYNLTPEGAVFSSGSAANYSITYADGSLEITARPITITADDLERYYGDANPTDGGYTVGGRGLVNDDALAATVALDSDALGTSGIGSYTLTPDGAVFDQGSAANYAITYLDGELVVTARPITITATDQSRIYGDSNPTTGGFTVGGEGLANDDALSGFVDVSSDALLVSNVGEYTLTPDGAAFTSGSSSNYMITYVDGSLQVTPATLTYVADTATRIYGDANPGFTGTVTGFKNGETLATATTGIAAFTTDADVRAGVGSHAVEGSGLTAVAGNYVFAQAAENADALSITPRPLTVTAIDQSRYYGDADPATAPVSADNLVNGDTIGGANVVSDAKQTSSVGTYTLTPNQANFTGGDASNYSITYVNGALQITPRPITITVENDSRVYGDANPRLGTLIGDNLANGDLLGTTVVSSDAASSSDVGSYSLTPQVAQFIVGNSANYDITFADGVLEVTPRAITLTANDLARIYGEANPTTGGYTIGGLGLANDDALATTLDLSSDADVTSNVGNYTLSANGAEFTSGKAGNYDITFADGVLEVTPRAITLTAKDLARIYGEANPTTGSYAIGGLGLANDDALAATLDLSSDADATSDVGNYTLSANGAEFTSGKAGNYDITYVDGVLEVTPRAITLTANDLARIYGEANPTTGGYTIGGLGLANDDALAATLDLSADADAASDVGNYTLSANGAEFTSGKAGNYAITYIDGVLEVTPRAITLTANDLARIYGEANPTTGSYTIGGLGLANDDALAATLDLSSHADATSDVGNYALSANGAEFTSGKAGNYEITYVDGVLEVTPRAITITAEDLSKIYGSADPALGYVVEAASAGRGLIAGDVFDGRIARDAGESVDGGPYTIHQGTLNNANYAITFVNGQMTIVPATLTYVADLITSTAGTAIPGLTGVVTGLVNGETLADATDGSAEWITAAGPSSQPGDYAVNGHGLTAVDGNYVFVQDSRNATALTLQASNDEPIIPDPVTPTTSLNQLVNFSRGDTSTADGFSNDLEIVDHTEPPASWLDSALFTGGGVPVSMPVSLGETGASTRLTFGAPREHTGMARVTVFSEGPGGAASVGAFRLEATSTEMHLEAVPGATGEMPSADASPRRASYRVDLGENQLVPVAVALSDSGLLVVEVPAGFLDSRGVQQAVLAGVFAAEMSLGVNLEAITAVKVVAASAHDGNHLILNEVQTHRPLAVLHSITE